MKDILKNVCTILAYATVGGCFIKLMSLDYNIELHTVNTEYRPRCVHKPKYVNRTFNSMDRGLSKAVEAINESDMWSSDKSEAISSIKHGFPQDVYYAVVSIAKSDMWSSDKRDAIEKLFKES